jgi:hypothetical protein
MFGQAGAELLRVRMLPLPKLAQHAKCGRTGLRAARLPDQRRCRSLQDNFHPSVLWLADTGPGGHEEIGFAVAVDGDDIARYAVAHQLGGHRLGAADGEAHIL